MIWCKQLQNERIEMRIVRFELRRMYIPHYIRVYEDIIIFGIFSHANCRIQCISWIILMHSHTEFHGYFYGLEELINKANTRCDDENDVLVFLECKEHCNNVGLGWAFRAEKNIAYIREWEAENVPSGFGDKSVSLYVFCRIPKFRTLLFDPWIVPTLTCVLFFACSNAKMHERQNLLEQIYIRCALFHDYICFIYALVARTTEYRFIQFSYPHT